MDLYTAYNTVLMGKCLQVEVRMARFASGRRFLGSPMACGKVELMLGTTATRINACRCDLNQYAPFTQSFAPFELYFINCEIALIAVRAI